MILLTGPILLLPKNCSCLLYLGKQSLPLSVTGQRVHFDAPKSGRVVSVSFVLVVQSVVICACKVIAQQPWYVRLLLSFRLAIGYCFRCCSSSTADAAAGCSFLHGLSRNSTPDRSIDRSIQISSFIRGSSIERSTTAPHNSRPRYQSYSVGPTVIISQHTRGEGCLPLFSSKYSPLAVGAAAAVTHLSVIRTCT